MSKQWEINRHELMEEPSLKNQLYNPHKFEELYTQLDEVCMAFEDKDIIKTLTRKITEEAVNIIQHNKSWDNLKVRTEFNNAPSRFKCEIIYDGGDYYDPETNNIGNVMGSTGRFLEYRRSHEINPDKKVTIRINIKLSP